MTPDSFRDWLRERGCKFEEQARGSGHVAVTVRCDGRQAELPMSDSHKDLDPEVLLTVVGELGLDPDELPRRRDRV